MTVDYYEVCHCDNFVGVSWKLEVGKPHENEVLELAVDLQLIGQSQWLIDQRHDNDNDICTYVIGTSTHYCDGHCGGKVMVVGSIREVKPQHGSIVEIPFEKLAKYDGVCGRIEN